MVRFLARRLLNRSGGFSGTGAEVFVDRLQHLVLPTVAVALGQIAYFSRYQRWASSAARSWCCFSPSRSWPRCRGHLHRVRRHGGAATGYFGGAVDRGLPPMKCSASSMFQDRSPCSPRSSPSVTRSPRRP
ncbi:MAG: hypothetical protein ACRDRH_07495 [Pseudonocardia sp.]